MEMSSVFFFSVVGMLPILSWEFVLVYGARIPVLKDTKFFNYYGAYYKWLMDSRPYEQTLMFMTLTLFFMMFSCYKIVNDQIQDSNRGLLAFMRKRTTDPRYSNIWKFIFFGLRYI
jgi:hypothetical protein